MTSIIPLSQVINKNYSNQRNLEILKHLSEQEMKQPKSFAKGEDGDDKVDIKGVVM
tara:strand:- start:13 stop:180 length:168 start_codon:yes stop_codon:yes gene_type:complete